MTARADHGRETGRAGFALLATPPIVWSAHFLACYVTAAVWCEKAPAAAADGLGWVPPAVALYTLVALAALGVAARAGWRHRREGASDPTHCMDTRLERRRFVGRATVLVAGLAGVATVFVAIVVPFAGSCR